MLGKCTMASPFCKTFDINNGSCLTCYTGFLLTTSGECIINIIQYDPNCNKFSGSKCIQCSKGAIFDDKGICVFSDPLCKTPVSLSLCGECYIGYIVNESGKCQLDLNFNCNKWVNGKCLTCSFGYYLNSVQKCVQVDNLCALFDYTNIVCKKCFIGYVLYQGSCKLTEEVPQ